MQQFLSSVNGCILLKWTFGVVVNFYPILKWKYEHTFICLVFISVKYLVNKIWCNGEQFCEIFKFWWTYSQLTLVWPCCVCSQCRKTQISSNVVFNLIYWSLNLKHNPNHETNSTLSYIALCMKSLNGTFLLTEPEVP